MGVTYQSWGRCGWARHTRVIPLFWRSEVPPLSVFPETVLPYGYGRSCGDSCVNDGGALLDASFLRRFIAFDPERGLLRCEAGVTLGDVLELIIPRGWFLPVTPGTQYVSIGGAIANDIHGKNHHKAGTFGCHVTRFELLRSTGERLSCSPTEHEALFRATIGGLGLTGVILWAEFRLKRIASPWIRMEQLRFACLDEFFDAADAFDRGFEYTVAWIDCLARGRQLGRGLYLCGNHEAVASADGGQAPLRRSIRAPVDLPSSCLNGVTMRMFNRFFYYAPRATHARRRLLYDRFFFHLDSVRDWNRLYGKRGFLEYQCVVPPAAVRQGIAELLRRVHRSGEGASLSIMKRFGEHVSPELMSFPRPGITLSMEFPNRGARTLRLLDQLDEVVRDGGGAVYLAKDARMSPESFRAYYPQWEAFAAFVDPKFSSNLWRRVTGARRGAA